MSSPTRSQTFLDVLVEAVRAAGAYNRQDQAPPAAVLWPDEERQWERLLPALRAHLPLFTLGRYAPEDQTGPAYWLRCIIARTIEHPGLPADAVPVLYLPGYGRHHIRALETCPAPLEPLAELQYRGVIWAQSNGRDWTISAFLQSRDRGLGIDVGGDAATKEALERSLTKLAEEPVEALRNEAPLRASFLDGLLHPDDVKNVLRWLNNPKRYREEVDDEEWAAFVALCEWRYDFHPEKDGPFVAAEKLGSQDGNWGTVWRRLAESPASYTTIADRLREARPKKTLPMLHHPESWPQDNEEAEASLRDALNALAHVDADQARKDILDLEREHGSRRSWVWATLGKAPLAEALGHLVTLAKATESVPDGTSVSEAMSRYAESGWTADLAALDVLASVERAEDVAAVRSAIRSTYRPWLEATVKAFQEVVEAAPGSYASSAQPAPADGTCILFTDGLRFDLAQRMAQMLTGRSVQCDVQPRLAALPTVTATAKPALSPVASDLTGATGFDASVEATGTKLNAPALRKLIGERGLQVLGPEDLGDPRGRAWTESGDIDGYGHDHGWKVAHHASAELRSLEQRIVSLLDHGWQKVVVVTDHGWLLLPGGLPKAEIPEHLTEPRKGRCARLKEGSKTDHQLVPWHWDPSVNVAVAPGIHCYEAGKEYEHGGLSPQECIVPVLTANRGATHEAVTIQEVAWRRLRCNVTVGGPAGLHVDIRTKVGDPATSLAEGGKEAGPDGFATLLVVDEDQEGKNAYVVAIGPDGAPVAHESTVIGGQ